MSASALIRAIGRAARRDSYYWAFRDARRRNQNRRCQVEVRLDLPQSALIGLNHIAGWRIAEVRLDKEMIFLRRTQRLANVQLRRLFRDALTMAYRHGGRFHSWMPDSGLTSP